MAFEPVYVVLDFWDRPRSGIAEYGGQPHHFECEFDAAVDDYADSHVLTPVDDETVALTREYDRIYGDWWAAFRRGEVAQSTHPALPGQNQRYAALGAAIKTRIAISPEPRARARGTFHFRSKEGSAFGSYEVNWQTLP